MAIDFNDQDQSIAALRPKTVLGAIAQNVLGLFCCVGLPAGFTAIAPVSYLKLSRNGDSVEATSKTCLLYCVPYLSKKVDDVIEVKTSVVAGEVVEDNRYRHGSDNTTRTEDQGYIVLCSSEKEIKIPISPASLDNTRRDIQNFLEAPEQTKFQKTCISNWKFAILFGGLATSLTVLYLVCIASSIVHIIWMAVRRIGMNIRT